MDIKIDTTSSAWKWLVEMKKEYQKSLSMETKRIEVKSFISGRKIGEITFGREN